ncbi:amino acid ABC transporter ATP-binding protein [Vagococcus salmoninarum]|uniref:Polar amino acid ABC transporter ATP-binding protein n=1 Tax=Vagococcus salmoninarum TaxID=2739 RepID=A0A429ZT37_9ENTE|nr:amino acid ABC transporter ATP-binding protein [Vagococcus salmoninarum]MBE9389804.1 amino acid ABC transporter ATP-binding protein [Vagococcus salmoninarum]RST96895.1 polar amino acid ABC transporter ATP-binding protein [Vagococcus salmoninarum]
MLELKNVTKEFNGKKILDSLDLSVPAGSILAITGPSGGGKTTLLRCICGLEKMDQGEIFVAGQKIDPQDHENSLERIGIVFQEFNLFPHLSIKENLTLAPIRVLKQSKVVAEKNSLSVLSQLDLVEQQDKYPYQLSGGQKQRVAIARALLMEPKVLCYDEPTSALDPALRDSVAETILSLKAAGMTQIVVTHDHEFAKKIADQLLVVEPIK